MKTTIYRSSVLMIVLAGALSAPAQLWSQERPAARTHKVRRGETLWSIAADSLGDGNRWREILRLNPGVRSSRSLVSGSTIRLPAASTPAGLSASAR
jgi:nucleoid-associated protein YgaU